MIEAICLAEYPSICTEQSDIINVGRITLTEKNSTPWIPDELFLRFHAALNSKKEAGADSRRNMTFSLNNNGVNRSVALAHDRAHSAYFTFNPAAREVIVEWGMINPKGDAKLHTYLNQVVDYPERAKQGMQLSSGHLARVSGSDVYLAYLDRLSINSEFGQNEPMARMINTLHAHGFIPITSEGFVQIPFF